MQEGNTGIKRLCRLHDGGKVAGVCAGLEEYFHVDVSLFRIMFVVSTFFGGFGLVTYIIMWLVVPLKHGMSANRP